MKNLSSLRILSIGLGLQALLLTGAIIHGGAGGGGGGMSLPADTIVTSEAAPLKIRGTGLQSGNGINLYQSSTGIPTWVGVCGGVEGDCDITVKIDSGNVWKITDSSSNSIVTITPGAGSMNAKYQFGANYKPIMTMVLPLEPRGAASSAVESIVSNQPGDWYLTVTDANTDAADFTFPVTARMAGATTVAFRLVGVSKNATPSGNIDFDCAVSTFTPGTDTFTAHVTTGEVTALLTPATQNRPVAVTTAAHTINGGALVAGDVAYGSCEVDATATTSTQMTDFRLQGWIQVEVAVNSWSD